MQAKHSPSEIKLHQKSQLLEISFTDNQNFKLSSEYLRTHAKSAEIETADKPVSGKAEVKIIKIEPQGNYALRIFFDDGYDSGIFSWDTLYLLGSEYDSNWADYLALLTQYNLSRETNNKSPDAEIKVRLMYFMTNMLKVTRKETEEITLPPSIKSVEKLLKLLRMRGKDWARIFDDNAVQITVNKQFAELFTKLEEGDEIALVPTSKDI